MAPPARQTKSAECALITMAVLLLVTIGTSELWCTASRSRPLGVERLSSHVTRQGLKASLRLSSHIHRRSSVSVKRLDRLESPGLTLLALRLAPANRFPVWRENQTRARIGDLHAITAGFIHIQKECLLDGVLVGTGFDVDAVLQTDVSGQEDLLAAVDGICDVVQASPGSGVVARIGKIVTLVGAGHPHRSFRAVVHHDLLGQAEAEVLLKELAVRFDVHCQPVPVV